MGSRNALKRARYQLGLTQEKFCKFLNISKDTYTFYEKGYRNPSAKVVKKIVEKLKECGIDITYDDFFNNKED